VPTLTIQELLQAGLAALSNGDIATASECCREVLKVKPDLVQAHFLVGLVALEGQDRKTAFQAFGSVTQLQPDHAAAWAQLAKLYMGEGQVNLADAALNKAGELNVNDPTVLDLMGTTWSMMGEYGEALACYTRVESLRPGHPPFMLNRANNLIYHGRTEEAGEVLNDIIRRQPQSPQAHWALAGAVTASDRTHIEQMQALVDDPQVHPRARAFYYYAIGKESEDLQDWEAAMTAFTAGAKSRRATVEYDEAAEVEMFSFLEQTFTADWLASQAPGSPDPSPIFVLGQPRTGTTLIERIISAHSQVHSAGELQQFSLAIRRLANHADPKRFSANFFAASLGLAPSEIAGLYLQTASKMRGTTLRFVDKLPQNYLMIPLILSAFPNARIVHLTRNPMDACFASYKQLFADAYLHSYDQCEMARHHARYLHLMECWRERFPGRIFDISYEATTAQLEPNARALIEYLELPWEDACLEFHRQQGAVSTASAVQVREPAHTRSIGRWRRYESQLQPMLETLQAEGVQPC